MTNFLLVLHFIITIALIGIILIQRNDGSAGALMGGGSTTGLITVRGAANLLTRVTSILAALFMGNCLLMAIVARHDTQSKSILNTPVQEISATSTTQTLQKDLMSSLATDTTTSDEAQEPQPGDMTLTADVPVQDHSLSEEKKPVESIDKQEPVAAANTPVSPDPDLSKSQNRPKNNKK